MQENSTLNLWVQEADSNRRPLGYEPSVITIFTILPSDQTSTIILYHSIVSHSVSLF